MKINQSQFNDWIKALRSGKYKQTTGALQDESGFCCLGVACDVLIPRHGQRLDYNVFEGVNYLAGGVPESQARAPRWLRQINEDFKDRTNPDASSPEDVSTSIAQMNDDMEMSFDEIADMLELTYIHNAFEKGKSNVNRR